MQHLNDIENSIALISLLNIFVVFYFLGQARVKFYGPFKKIFVSSHQTQKRPTFIPTIFLFLFSRLLTHTSSTILMDARQWVGVLLLLRLSFLICIAPPNKIIIIINVLTSHCSTTNQSGTNCRACCPLHTASLHIFCVLGRSGTNSNYYGSMHTASSHISCVLR